MALVTVTPYVNGFEKIKVPLCAGDVKQVLGFKWYTGIHGRKLTKLGIQEVLCHHSLPINDNGLIPCSSIATF